LELRYNESCHYTHLCYIGEYRGRTITGMINLEYLLSKHGVQEVPAIIRAFARYSTWRSLADGLYGLQEAEFRTGWCAYLVREYGIANCAIPVP
jgi:hypothetical protein